MDHRGYAWALIPALAVGLFAVSLYGYNEHTKRSAAVSQVELGYQTIYHNVSYDADEMQDALRRAEVTTQTLTINRELRSAAQHAALAARASGSLPISVQSHPLTAFFHDVETRCTQLMDLHAAATPLTPSERSDLSTMASDATRVEQQLRTIQRSGFRGSYPLTNFVKFGASAVNASPLAKQFTKMNQTVFSLRATHQAVYLKSFAADRDPVHDEPSLASVGSVISSQQAIARATSFVGGTVGKNPYVAAYGTGSAHPFYLVTFHPSGPQSSPLYVSVFQHGGYVFEMAREGFSGGTGTSVADGRSIAKQFLWQHGFPSVTLVESDAYHGQIFTKFAPLRQGVPLENQTILVTVAQGARRVTHYDASAYFEAEPYRGTFTPKITAQDAVKAFSAGVKTAHAQLVVCAPHGDDPRLAYRFFAMRGTNTYIVDVDAQNGRVLAIAKQTKL
ncbi:PepSY1/2 domain-containing protein [Ferroacidibacillus organovorans]|uniref:PepSY domain-containing protein n=1 Tax=Ferroacidibacillus organovorans TaxID=1765683 RepID=A0A853KEE6_9BACL|nr:PepSY1/2 domain-containing protein [Ferroacidibacillus organovorans]KYP80479.1 hypothetical protein AYJ22_02195 [Ferroacidibacillus organovorans]OAG94708.1 hypothetical protein AYW79_03965 [Ferroacidibacillus organovorans]